MRKLVLAVAMLAATWAAQGQRLSTYSLTVDTALFNTIVSTGTAMSFTNLDDGYAVVTLPFAIAFGESSFPAGTQKRQTTNDKKPRVTKDARS